MRSSPQVRAWLAGLQRGTDELGRGCCPNARSVGSLGRATSDEEAQDARAAAEIEEAIWESLALVQLLILYHLVTAKALGGEGSRTDGEAVPEAGPALA